MGIKIKQFIAGQLENNMYLVMDEDTKSAVLIDATELIPEITDTVKQLDADVKYILLTHGHFDHIQGVRDLKNAIRCEICALDVEKELLSDARMNVSAMTGRPEELEADIWLHDGQQFESAGIAMKVIHTPGHTKGSCCYFLEEQKVLFSGDTLFMESVGRADLPTGNEKDLMQSVREKVLTLPSETKVFSGHGPSTSIEYEQANNPYA